MEFTFEHWINKPQTFKQCEVRTDGTGLNLFFRVCIALLRTLKNKLLTFSAKKKKKKKVILECSVFYIELLFHRICSCRNTVSMSRTVVSAHLTSTWDIQMIYFVHLVYFLSSWWFISTHTLEGQLSFTWRQIYTLKQRHSPGND